MPSYSAMDLYRDCERRSFEERRLALGTDRIVNDMVRMTARINELESLVADIEDSVPTNISDQIESLERAVADLED